MNTVVFSPHTDDAIFSIGAYITGLKARIVTPFAGVPDDEAGRQKHTTLRADQVFIPFGIHHPDHLLTTNMAIALVYNNPIVPARICFYEDLPYRVDYPHATMSRFAHLENIVGRLKLIEDITDERIKRAAVDCYKSQTGGDVMSRVMVRERIWELVR